MPDYFIDQQGQRWYTPGAPTNIDGTSLSAPNPAAKGNIAWVYQASRGGEPYVPMRCDSASAVKALLPAEVAEVVTRLAFTPANDVKVPSGASRLILVRANPAERAQLVLVNGDGNVATFKAADWGLYGNDIQINVETGTGGIGKKFTAQYGGLTQVVDNAGNLDAFNAIYVAPGSTPPAGYALTVLKIAVDPNVANGSPVVTINYAFTGNNTTINPSSWMAFDGAVNIAIDAQAAGASRDFDITGVLKAAIPGHSAGETYTETVTVASAGNASTVATWSEITSIAPAAATEGTVTYTGNAFALNRKTSTGTSAYDTLTKIVDRINAFSARGFGATLSTARTTLDPNNLDKVATPQAINDSDGYTVPMDLYDFIAKVSAGVSWGTITRTSAATGVPSNLVYTHLAGGADGDGESVQSDGKTGYQKAIEALQNVKPVNTICCDSSAAAVHALVKTHLDYMGGRGQDERNAVLGVPGATSRGTTAGQLYALRNAVASRNMSLCCQKVDTYQSGVQVTLEPPYLALMIAAVQAGRVKGTGVTWKYLNALAITDNPGTAATNWTDADNHEELIEYGYTLVETTDRGFRVRRGNTSYGQDDNALFSSMVANESANQSAKNLRTVMQAFIGENNTVPKAVIKSKATTELDRQVKEGEIFGWRNLDIVIAGNYVTTDVEVAPTEEFLWTPVNVRLYRGAA